MLYAHQNSALTFAEKNNFSCALFHDPGLGKTLSALECYRRAKMQCSDLVLIVVCPMSLIEAAWGQDIKRFTDFSYLPLKKLKDNVPDILIINYESAITKKLVALIEKIASKYKTMCVLDESSRLKNHKSITTKTFVKLAHLFKFRMILSGTPMPNSEEELWGQIQFVKPGLLPPFFQFRNTFFHLERNGKKMDMPNGTIMTREFMQNVFSKGWQYKITDDKRAKLMELIAPYVQWVKKEDAIDLPEKIDEIRDVFLSDGEREAYNDMKRHLLAEINGIQIAAPVALAKIMKLRQATSGFMYDAEGKSVFTGKSKLNTLIETVEEIGNQPTIIFVQFHEEIHQIQEYLTQKYGSESIVTLYSETENKDESIKRFKENGARFLIAHPRSAAHGLTFVNCRAIIFYSMDYSFEAHEQARNRIHRIGQNGTCLYIYLIAKNTIDEVMLSAVRSKNDLQETVHEIFRNCIEK